MARKTFKRLLFDRGITILDLSRTSGVDRSTIWRWCEGTTMPRTKQIHAVANALRMDPAELLDAIERGSKPTPQPR